jgi:hypothetical protein
MLLLQLLPALASRQMQHQLHQVCCCRQRLVLLLLLLQELQVHQM